MRRTLVLCGVLLALAAASAAAETTDDTEPLDALEDPRPGLITADSPLYGLDIAVDNVLMAVGLRSASDVVHKRASEAVVAAEANETAAAERAVAEAHRTARVAHGGHSDGLETAEQLLLEVRDQVPEDTHNGIDHALNEIVQAQERTPLDVVDREPELPDDLDGRSVPDHVLELAGGDQ
ncbi:hypothetical protein [Natronorubrum sp. A-ect3]|uniref:hypothetical protein n=1 Tax=Natronorubrum sp. A-ect3 TaxID=3242698 RepID=UPI00359DBC97